MSNQKIKSIKTNGITFSLPDFKFSVRDDNFIHIYSQGFTADVSINNAQIEYEKPKLLKRPDGSLISEPERSTEIYRINPYNFKVYYDKFIPNDDGTKLGYNFLKEDGQKAEKKAQMLSKQLEIKNEIDRLNAEEGWVANWKSQNQSKSYLSHDHTYPDGLVNDRARHSIQQDNQYMSAKTASTILAKYSQDELKQYLGINF